MVESREISQKKRFFYSLIIPGFVVFVAFTLKLVEDLEGISLAVFGINPRTIEGLTGIITSPLIHGDWEHFFANALPLLILGTALFYFYRGLSLRVFILIWLITGVLVWFGGRAGSWHIGASGVIYGIGTFLFFSGVIRNYIPLMAISLIVVFLYGSLFWGMIPVKWDLPYSWEAHLYGSITGLILALIYRDKGPQRPEPDWAEDEEEDENEDDENAYWKTNIS